MSEVGRATFGSSGVQLEPKNHGVYSPNAQPDAVRKHHRGNGKHNLYEQKVVCPVSTSVTGTSPVGAHAAFANTEDELLDSIAAQYTAAACLGHQITPVIMETFGGFSPGAEALLDELARKHGARLGADEQSAPWCARSFRRLHAMRITIALHCAAADEILQTVELDVAADAQRCEE